MSEHREKLADLDRQIAEAVSEREGLIQRIPNLPPRSPEKAEAVRHRDALNEVLVSLRRYRRALDNVQR
ncbi:hypothetical protein [Methylobacterium indicum]|jgi:hypothetical protein|uniref:Uncharacterized protein n=1 Tax=Methylobacterium indicum TaxID=1775910 RepID=A0A8H8X1T7_9HYPH|nr:hypothetical protein [Methylobacterium indicum]BCM87987.1 hypothetical protein mvi_64480 [Methylobacterium indicum]